MVLIPGIIKTYFFKKTERERARGGEKTGGRNKGARLEQIGHRWERQLGSRGALPHILLPLLLFEKRELYFLTL